MIFHDVCYLHIFISISFKNIFLSEFQAVSNFIKNSGRPDLSPNCLLMFSVVLPPVVIEQSYIREKKTPVFYQVAFVVSVAMTREKTHAI